MENECAGSQDYTYHSILKPEGRIFRFNKGGSRSLLSRTPFSKTTPAMQLRSLLISLMILPLVAVAQFQPRAQASNWQVVSSEHFDVYHQPVDETSAELVAKLAEKARYEVLMLFDVRPEGRYSLVYFSSPVDLVTSNLSLRIEESGPGLFRLPTNRGVIVHPGTTPGLYDEIKKEVTKFLMNEFAYGNRVGSSIQMQLLLHNAVWFRDGLKEYVSEGWTFRDEMWVNTLASTDLLDMAMEGEGELNRTVRKSIWYFIAHEYGEQKLSEIVYLVNISNSVESGIVSVLGITLNTLTTRWRDYIMTRADTQRNRRVDLSEWNDVMDIPFPGDMTLSTFAWHGPTGQIAAWFHQEGAFRLYIYHTADRNWEATGLQMGTRSAQASHISFRQLPLAWSPGGDELATVLHESKHRKYLVYLNTETGKVRDRSLRGSYQDILDLAWSHDKASLAATILHDGQIDLFTTRAGEADFNAVTNDVFDERDPAWSLDDQRIFFASNRDTSNLKQNRAPWELTESLFDIYAIDRSEGGKLERLTQTSFTNERNPMAISSFQIKYLTDESGIWNLHVMNIFLREQEAVTNIDIGIAAWSGDEESIVMAAPYGGKMKLYRVETDLLTAPPTPELTLLRLEYIAAFQARERKKRRAQEAEIAVRQREQALANAEQEEETREPEPEPQQAEEEEEEPVRYYIFDEEDQPYDIQRPSRTETNASNSPTQPRRWSTSTTNRRTQKVPDLADIDLSPASRAGSGFTADYLNLGFAYDPLAGVGLNLGLGFTDVLERHNLEVSVQPFINNSFYHLRYTYKPGRIDWYGEANFMSRQFRHQTQVVSDSLLFKYHRTRVSGGLIFPFSTRAALDLKVGYHNLNRFDQQVRRAELLDAKDHLLHAGATLTYQDVDYQENFRYGGYEGFVNWGSYYSVDQQQFAFHRITGEVSAYTPLYEKITLASRIGASFTFPNTVQQNYLGGVEDQLLLFALDNTELNSVAANSVDTSLHSFMYQQFITQVRGFRPVTRDGSRYLVGNFEVRIPISRLLRHGLNSNSLYNFEFIPFIDVGAVWTEGNPFNQKKPTDTRIITSGNVTIRLQTLKSPFLMGIGTGLRMNILSYSLRGDLAWGIDDQTLTNPMLMISVGKNF